MKIILMLTIICLLIFGYIMQLRDGYTNQRVDKIMEYLYEVGLTPKSEFKPYMIWKYNVTSKILINKDGSAYIPLIAKDWDSFERGGLKYHRTKDNYKTENSTDHLNFLTLDSLINHKR